MPFNGAGTFTRIYSWVADAASAIDITASRMDTDTNDIVSSGLNNALTRDGQGIATANLPMGGFRHTGAGSAVGSGDYVTLGQTANASMALSVASVTASGAIHAASFATTGGAAVGAYLGETRSFALPAALLPTGWQFCYGQTRPRTDPLWLATGAVNAAYWIWGNGDGSTTYTMPDFRGRALFGKDDMGGSAANRITAAVSGVNGTTLGAAGGDQAMQSHTHIATDSGHTHSITDPGHVHSVPNLIVNGAGGSNLAASGIVGVATVSTTSATTGITGTNSGTANVTNATTGAGSSQNLPPTAIVNIMLYTGA